MAEAFKDLFVRRFGCAISDYEAVALRKLLYWHARPIGGLLLRLRPRYMRKDFGFIEALGESEDYQEAALAIAEFRGANMFDRTFARKWLKVRVSGRAAMRILRVVYSGGVKK